jgi:hypothetical protein
VLMVLPAGQGTHLLLGFLCFELLLVLQHPEPSVEMVCSMTASRGRMRPTGFGAKPRCACAALKAAL